MSWEVVSRAVFGWWAPPAGALRRAARQSWRTWLPGALLALVLTTPAWTPVLWPHFNVWQLYDGGNHLRKAFFLAQSIKDGNWYPRWTPQEYGGYGYPTLNFYAPATYYLMLALAALPRVGLYGALQIVGALEEVAIVGGVYALGWTTWRHQPAAVLAAGAVAYGPYIFPNLLYLSGWIPQLIGLALLVWLLMECLCLWRCVSERRPARQWWAIALTTAALLVTHNASAIIGLPMILTWLVCLWVWRRTPWPVVYAATAAAAGAAAAAVLWLPALADAPLVQVERMMRGNLNYRDHFLAWPGYHREDVWGLQERSPFTVGTPLDLHLIYPNSAYGPTKLSLWQGLIAFAALVSLAVVGVHTVRRARRGGASSAGPAGVLDGRRLTILSIVFGLLMFFFGYSQSFDWWLPAWDRFAILRAVQLPERFLAPALYGIALAAGGSLALLLAPGRRAWLVTAVALVVLGIAGTGHRPLPLAADVSHEVSVNTAIDTQRQQPGFADSTEEFLPRTAGYVEWHENEARGFWLYERMFPEAAWIGGRVRAWQGPVAVRALWGRLLWTEADVDAGAGGGTLAFHQLAFPGWRAWIDGQPAPVRVTPPIDAQAIQPGFLLVDIPAGSHRVVIRFGPDTPRLEGIAVSLATLAAAAAWLLFKGFGGRSANPKSEVGGPSSAVRSRRAPSAVRRPLYVFAGALVAASVLIAGCRTVQPLRPPGTNEPAERILVAGIVDDVLAGRAAVNSPTGSVLGPDRFVDVRYLSVQAQDRPLRDAGPNIRRWLFTHPPTEVAVDLKVPPDAYFQAGLALDPASWDAPLGDGVRYLVTVTPHGGQPATVLDAAVNPRARGEQRRWLDVVADLRPWAGQEVRLALRTDPREDPNYDWAGWSEPAVVRLDPLTAARLMDSTTQTAAVALRP